MRRGIGRLRAASSGSTDADAAAWAAAVTGAGGTYSAGTLAAVSAFCASAKASNYWTKLNRINLFCGNQLAAALVPLKVGGGSATDTNVNFVAGDYTEATGITGNGTTKYLNTGLVPTVSLSLNSTHLAIYSRAASAVGTGNASIGASSGDGGILQAAFPLGSDGKHYFYPSVAAAGSFTTAAAATAPYRLVAGTRTAAAVSAIYQDGSSVATSVQASNLLPSVAIFLFGRNSAGTPTDFSGHTYAAYSIGDGLSGADAAAYATHMQTFQTALARNV